ncbi:MAG: response regulator [Anaerolineae bacterium]|nr:response regulator [Anaerolineae bacterium]
MNFVKVLVADTNPVETERLCTMLQGMLYQARGADVNQFDEILREYKPELILMDLSFAEKINLVSATFNVEELSFPVVFMLPQATDPSSLSLLASSPYGYLFKPCENPMLDMLIKTDLNRLNLERQLAESRVFYEMLVNESSDAVWVTDEQGKVTLANESACKLTGYSRKELIGKDIHGLFSEFDRLNKYAYMMQIRAGKLAVSNCTLKLKNGNFLDVELHSKTLANGNLQAVARNILERKTVDKLINESEKRYHSLFSQMLDGFALHEIICNAEGVPVDYRFLEINPAFEQMTGLSAKNVVGKTVLEVLPKTEKYWIERYGRVALSKIPTHFIDYSVEFDKHFEVSAYCPRQGQFAVIVEDISDQIKMHQTLEEERASLAKHVADRTADLSVANLQLAKAARMKDEFLANMSHELRTPLTGILGISEALQSQVYGELNDRQVKAVQNIADSGAHLLALINDILDFTKIDSGKIELDVMPFSLETACQASLRLVKQNAQKKQQKIIMDYDNNIRYIMGDEKRIKQILVNLLSNAVKFTPENGSIGIETCGDREAGLFYITIWDTGIGIKPEDMQRLFAPFVQLDSSLNRHFNGTGLGLSLVLRLVELHGGSISVNSEPGKGSRFILTLPWNDVPETSIQENKIQTMHSIPAIRGALVVEDTPADIELIDRYLKEINVQNVHVFTNALNILEKVKELSPDVILLDLFLPDQNGFDILKELKSNSVTASIPVIIVSVMDEQTRGKLLGASDYLIKPVNPERIRQSFARIFANCLPQNALVARADKGKRKVLLVEDNPVNLNTISDFLLVKGFVLDTATNGFEAIEKTITFMPDIILMDVQMPVMNGMEATRRIRADQRISHIPIVALTALAMDGDRERCLEAGMNEYLSKPIRLEQLPLIIKNLLSSAN